MDKKFLILFLIIITTIVSTRNVNAQSLVGYWKFDEDSGSIAQDSSGNNNYGTIYSATWTANCKSNYCLSFDGVNDYVDVTDNGGFDNMPQITVMAWFKLDQLASAKGEKEYVVAKKHNGTPYDSYYMRITTSNTIQFSLVNSTQGQVSATSPTAIQAGVWYFVACNYDGSSMKIYINGDLNAAAIQIGSIFDSNYPFRIGADWSGGDRMNGTIDEVRVYNYALTENEIKALYSSAVKVYGKLADKDNNPQQAKIAIYQAGTNILNTSNQTNSNGNYNLVVSHGMYDVQFNLTNLFIPNYGIKLLSMNVNSDLYNLITNITGYSSENKVSFDADIDSSQVLQTYGPNKPKKVSINGTSLTEVSSLSELKNNTWFYSPSDSKLSINVTVSSSTTTTTTTSSTTTTTPTTNLVYSSDFETMTRKDSLHVNMGIDNYQDYEGGGTWWIEGLERTTSQVAGQSFACHSGTRCMGLEVRNHSIVGGTPRSEFNIMHMQNVVGNEFYVSVWLYLPADFQLHSDNINFYWYSIGDIFMSDQTATPVAFNPYSEIHIHQSSLATPPDFSVDPDIRDNLGSGLIITPLATNPHFPLPRGRWFNLKFYVYRDVTNGIIKMWMDGILVCNVTVNSSSPIKTRNANDNAFFITVGKIYYEPSDSYPLYQIWIDDLQIYNGMP